MAAVRGMVPLAKIGVLDLIRNDVAGAQAQRHRPRELSEEERNDRDQQCKPGEHATGDSNTFQDGRRSSTPGASGAGRAITAFCGVLDESGVAPAAFCSASFLVPRLEVLRDPILLDSDQKCPKKFNRIDSYRTGQFDELDDVQDTVATLHLSIDGGVKPEAASHFALGQSCAFAGATDRLKQKVKRPCSYRVTTSFAQTCTGLHSTVEVR